MWETTRDRFVRINGTWIRVGAVEAIAPTTAGKARVHLSGGTTVGVPLRPHEDVTTVMNALTAIGQVAADIWEEGRIAGETNHINQHRPHRHMHNPYREDQ